MMKRLLLLTAVVFTFVASALAQEEGGSILGFKGGLAMTNQQWTGVERQPLFLPQGDFFVEDIPTNNMFALFASLGYHPKGSALRNAWFNSPFNNQLTRVPPTRFVFHNLSLILGAKQKFDFGSNSETRWFYSFGLRGDYTIANNLNEFDEINAVGLGVTTFPVDDPTYIREINYGVSIGGGIEYSLSEFVGLSIEFNVHPDFSFQYEQPEIRDVTDPFTSQLTSIPERQIRNLALELSVGLRFLRKVIYVD